jgi:hypothetical protein
MGVGGDVVARRSVSAAGGGCRAAAVKSRALGGAESECRVCGRTGSLGCSGGAE